MAKFTLSPFFKLTIFGLVAIFSTTTVRGIIFYDYGQIGNEDYNKNQTPSSDSDSDSDSQKDIFNAVARICDENGQGTSGSATYIRGKYLLTADHVQVKSHVVFDNGPDPIFYEIDTNFTPITISKDGDIVDLKLIKLLEVPLFDGKELKITLNDVISDNNNLSNSVAILVGWGVGHGGLDTSVINGSTANESNIKVWKWGNQSTLAKRWGTNLIELNDAGINLTYDKLTTKLDPILFYDQNEAGLALYDSGCGLFAQVDNKWKLIGIATAVTELTGPKTSTFSSHFDNPFSNDDDDIPEGDLNYFVRISSYVTQIEEAIPDPLTYEGWKIDYSLYNENAENTVDTDGDGINQLLEFALGGDPNKNDISILPTYQFIKNDNESYLEMTLTRPKGIKCIEYIPQITTDFDSWRDPITSDLSDELTELTINGLHSNEDGNEDGNETLKYRLRTANTDKKFMCLLVRSVCSL